MGVFSVEADSVSTTDREASTSTVGGSVSSMGEAQSGGVSGVSSWSGSVTSASGRGGRLECVFLLVFMVVEVVVTQGSLDLCGEVERKLVAILGSRRLVDVRN
jgi:hypothetical protein